VSVDSKALFRKWDLPDEWERPTSYNRSELLASIESTVKKLSKKANSTFYVKDQIEDASFCAEAILGQRTTSSGIYEQRLIFSNFGKMVTVNDPELPRSLILLIKEVLEEEGFHYIEFEMTESEYDGVIKDTDRIRTWFTRFFDYL
jgi:hypothetical protein